jgi:hypothetical protein
MENTQLELDANGYLTKKHSSGFLNPLVITIQPHTVRLYFKEPLCNLLFSVRSFYNRTEGRESMTTDSATTKTHLCVSIDDVHAECRLLFDHFALNTTSGRDPNLGIRCFRYLNVIVMIQSYGDCSTLSEANKGEIITELDDVIQREEKRANIIFSLVGVNIQ